MGFFCNCRTEEVDGVGRPLLSVDMYEVEFLRSLRFTWTDIASLLGVSRSTLYRRITIANLTNQNYSTLSDCELDSIICRLKADHPNDGEVLISGHLKARRIFIQRSRLRASIHRIDPHVQNNMRSAIRRRTYYAASPNYTWHIDTNHKLIRWRFIVQGGIDGYSRMVVFLKCSTNNLASTMLSAFLKGVQEYGLPNRIRSDLGGENVDVWRFVLEQYNNDERHVITGSSTHNERVERLWRDVNRCVLKPFANQFRLLEENGLLDPLNEVDMFCLHFSYHARIEQCISFFQEAWNNHQLSSESNATPMQMFIAGMISTDNAPSLPTAMSNFVPPLITIGDHIRVPRSRFTPCSVLTHQLESSQFDPLAYSNCFDDGLFVSVLSLVGQHIMSNCPSCT